MKPLVLKKRKVKGKYSTLRCPNSTTGTLCPSCRSRKSRLADPVKYSYQNKKDRARQRDIFWDLTLDQFRQFCYETQYIQKAGKTAGSYDVDRIIEGKTPGYTITNIQLLEKTKNIRKWLEFNWLTKEAKVVSNKSVNTDSNLPF